MASGTMHPDRTLSGKIKNNTVVIEGIIKNNSYNLSGALRVGTDTTYKLEYDDYKIKLLGSNGSESIIEDLTVGLIRDICTF